MTPTAPRARHTGINRERICPGTTDPSVAAWALHGQPTGYNTGMPFGLMGQKEVDHLNAYAKREGFDLMGDTTRAYQKDEAALGRVFAFSLKFAKLDRNAKTYGQIIYSSFLNLAEVYGMERYSRIVAAQPKAVQQRIRDFIYFDATQAPKKIREAVEASARKVRPTYFRTTTCLVRTTRSSKNASRGAPEPAESLSGSMRAAGSLSLPTSGLKS